MLPALGFHHCQRVDAHLRTNQAAKLKGMCALPWLWCKTRHRDVEAKRENNPTQKKKETKDKRKLDALGLVSATKESRLRLESLGCVVWVEGPFTVAWAHCRECLQRFAIPEFLGVPHGVSVSALPIPP